jgi:hypothetical protein
MFDISLMISKTAEIFFISLSSGLEMGLDGGRCHLVSSRALWFEEAISSAL